MNTVGPSAAGTFEQLTDQRFRASIYDGVMGTVHCVRSAFPLLASRRNSYATGANVNVD